MDMCRDEYNSRTLDNVRTNVPLTDHVMYVCSVQMSSQKLQTKLCLEFFFYDSSACHHCDRLLVHTV